MSTNFVQGCYFGAFSGGSFGLRLPGLPWPFPQPAAGLTDPQPSLLGAAAGGQLSQPSLGVCSAEWASLRVCSAEWASLGVGSAEPTAGWTGAMLRSHRGLRLGPLSRLDRGERSGVVPWLDFYCGQGHRPHQECRSPTSKAGPHAEIMVVYPQKLL